MPRPSLPCRVRLYPYRAHPDFIPILGLLDELFVVPLGVVLVKKMIPSEVLAECRQKSLGLGCEGKPINHVAAAAIIYVWLLLAVLTALAVIRRLQWSTLGL